MVNWAVHPWRWRRCHRHCTQTSRVFPFSGCATEPVSLCSPWPFTPHTSGWSPCAPTPPIRVRTDYKGKNRRTTPQILCVFKAGELGLWIGCSEKRNVIPPPPDQRRTSVLFSVGQCLWKGFPFALWKQKDGENGQQSQRRVDHVMQEVAVVITQIH